MTTRRRPENAKLHGGKSRLRKKAEVVLLVLLCGWVVGGTLHGLIGETGEFANRVPDSLVAEVVERLPAHRYYLVFDVGSCGTPFQTTVNYLYNRELGVDVAILTSDRSAERLRGLRKHSGPSIYGGHDDLVAKVSKHVNALLVERSPSGQLLLYPFDRPSMSEYVAVLDDVFGTSMQQRRGEPVDPELTTEHIISL